MKTIWFSKESLGSLLGLFSIYLHELRDALIGYFKKIWSLFFPVRRGKVVLVVVVFFGWHLKQFVYLMQL